jgi:Asp-tRNA(Asn)/Glu-tRNA(Gln) amidotransferase A subunit family amidase
VADSTTYTLDGTPGPTVDELCDRIDAVDRELHAFVPGAETSEDRRARWHAALAALPDRAQGGERLPLYGVPVGVKDIVRVDGLPTRAGSRLPAEAFAGPQAVVADRLAAAGALVAGKTVTAEFAILAPGPTRNPRNLEHTPGGSSSGSAAAVAAGLVPLAIGTQTVGSVIRPSAYCGIVGFKPTFGRIPVDGVVPNAPSYDTLGVHAATVADAARAAAVLCDGWRTIEVPRPPVLGVPDGPYLERAQPEALAAFEGQAAALAEAGFEVRRVPLFADFERVVADLFTVNRHEAARSHADWFARYGGRYREQTAAVVREGQGVDAARYEEGLRRRAAFQAALAEATGAAGVDVWISPAATGPAPRGLESTGSSIMCLPWSNAGWPALTVPAGAIGPAGPGRPAGPGGSTERAGESLPLGLQCVARPGHDEELLVWARPLEAVLAPAPAG